MLFRTMRTAQQTLSGTTGSVTTGKIHGIIDSVKVKTEASIAITIATTGSPIVEYLVGTAGGGATVASDAALYPRTLGHLDTDLTTLGVANKTNAYCKHAIDSAVNISVVGTDTKKWSVEIFYED